MPADSTSRLILQVALLVHPLACGHATRPVPPAIIVQPLDQAAATCSDAGFVVVATGTAPLTYQWRKDGASIPGATGDRYLVTAAVAADAGAYSVAITNGVGTTVSQEASLTVSGVPPDPSGQVVIAAEPAIHVEASDTAVLWTGGGRGYIRIAPLPCGRPVRTVYERTSLAIAPYATVLDGERVWWSDGGVGGVWRSPVSGGMAEAMAPGFGSIFSLARAGSQVYWTDPYGATIRAMPLAGGDIVSFAVGTHDANGPNEIATDDLYVYWNDVYEQTVKRMPLGGGPITVLASGQGYLTGLAVDGANVYWAATDTVAGVETGNIRKVSRDGGTPSLLATRQGATALAVAVDGTHVFWTSDTLLSQEAGTGVLARVRPDGSDAAVVADGLTKPYDLTTDPLHVYWVEEGASLAGRGRVVRIKK